MASGKPLHFRGRDRLSFVRQITDHSTFSAPYNLFVYCFSAVPDKPILSVADFPESELSTDRFLRARDPTVTCSSIHLAKHDVLRTDNGNNVGQHVTFNHLGHRG